MSRGEIIRNALNHHQITALIPSPNQEDEADLLQPIQQLMDDSDTRHYSAVRSTAKQSRAITRSYRRIPAHTDTMMNQAAAAGMANVCRCLNAQNVPVSASFQRICDLKQLK